MKKHYYVLLRTLPYGMVKWISKHKSKIHAIQRASWLRMEAPEYGYLIWEIRNRVIDSVSCVFSRNPMQKL